MPFNADTYRMNKYRKSARKRLADIRDIRARDARREAFAWEVERIPSLVRLARIDWHLYLSAKRIAAIGRAARGPG